jgi:predicted transposase YdaD
MTSGNPSAYRKKAKMRNQISERERGLRSAHHPSPSYSCPSGSGVFAIRVKQFQADPDLYARLFTELFLYLRDHRPVHPWHAVVLYRTRALDPGESGHSDALVRSERVTRLYLDEWAQPRQTLAQQLVSVVLEPPAQAVPEAQAVLREMAAPGIDRALAAAIVNLVETIMVYKLPTLSREEIQRMLNVTEIDLKQTRFYQDVHGEGRQEGEALLVLRLLQRRCGELPPALRERIARLSILQLETLADALLDFGGRADLEQWVAAHVPSS